MKGSALCLASKSIDTALTIAHCSRMPAAIGTSGQSSTGTKSSRTEYNHVRGYGDELDTIKEAEHARVRYRRRHEAKPSMRNEEYGSYHDPSIIMRSLPAVPTPHTTPSTPSTISRLKLNAVSKFRHIGRKSVQNNRPQESNVRRQEFDEVFVSPVPRDSRPLNVTRSQLQTQTGHSLARQEIPAHARHSSTPVINTTLHNSPRVSDVGRALTQPRSPSSSHNGAPQIQHSRAPRPSLDRAAPNSHSPVPNPPRIRLERRRTTGARTDNQRSVDSPAQSTSSRRDTATHTPMSPAISSRMGRFGIYASPSPTVVGGSVSSPAPHQRWMPASPRPLDAGKVVADARRETPRHPVQAAVITDSHVESGFSVAGDATSVTPGAESAKNVTGNTIGPPEDLPTPRPRPRTRKQTLKEEEVFAMKLANRMSAFIPQRSSVASPRICQDNELYPIINLNNDGEDGEEGDVSDGETNSEHRSDTLTPKAVDQSKGLPSEETASGVPESLKGDERKTESATPLSTFLSSAKEMNDNFIKSTSSAWDKLFFRSSGSGKGKEKECNPVTDTIPSNSSSASTPTPSRTTLSSSTPAPTPDQVYAGTGEGEIEGSRDIMLYSPLIPTSSSLVEVGESEVVSFYGEDEGVDRAYRAELRRRWADGRGFVSFESLAAMGKAEENSNAEDQTMRSPDNALQIDLGDDSGSRVSAPGQNPEQSDDADNKTPKVKERVVWKPSPTQISVQVLWWGYRMYLPPPVLVVLNNRSVETAKRAAMLTSALTWLLSNLPLNILPPALAPAALLLKALVPLLSAIGTFISWSWKAVVTFDKGNGVVLSATWLLPIVVVPGTWEDDEVPPVQPNSTASSTVSAGYSTGRVEAYVPSRPQRQNTI